MIKIAIYQGGYPEGLDENISIMETQAKKAKEANADLILFCECFLGGYVSGDSFKSYSESTSGENFSKICNIARSTGIAIVFGYIESYLDETGTTKLANSCAFVDKSGCLIANYRKLHLWQSYENAYFTPGDKLGPVFDFQGVKVAMMICYDVEFPEVTRCYALQGCQLFLVPTALMTKLMTTVTVISRAVENNAYLAYANRVGTEHCAKLGRDLTFCGNSVIVAPNGEALARASETQPDLIFGVVDVHGDCIKEAIEQNPYLHDRRPELYSALASNPQFPTSKAGE